MDDPMEALRKLLMPSPEDMIEMQILTAQTYLILYAEARAEAGKPVVDENTLNELRLLVQDDPKLKQYRAAFSPDERTKKGAHAILEDARLAKERAAQPVA